MCIVVVLPQTQVRWLEAMLSLVVLALASCAGMVSGNGGKGQRCAKPNLSVAAAQTLHDKLLISTGFLVR